MTMAWNIDKLRESGDSADATLADMLQLRLEARGDFDFPDNSPEGVSYVPDTKTPQELSAVALQDVIRPGGEQQDVVLLSEMEQTRVLVDRLRTVAQPFIEEARARVPLTDTTPIKKTKLLRRVKELTKSNEVVTRYEQVLGNQQFWFETKTGYSCKDEFNVLNGIKVHIYESQEASVADYRAGAYQIEIKVDHGTATEISMSGNNIRHLIAEKGLLPIDAPMIDGTTCYEQTDWDGDILGGQPARDSKWYYPMNYHTIRFDDTSIDFYSSKKFLGHYNRGIYEVNRTFDPARNVFTTAFTDTDGKTLHGQDMSIEDVMLVASTALKLIPKDIQ